jgi:peptidoglycan/xylan/chitin deacetylase (PgdA/CDA1 family)
VKLILFATLLAVTTYLGYTIVEEPGSQLFGKTVTNGPSDAREVALTFDDGPNPPYTDRILDVLRDEHVHATFFVVGRTRAPCGASRAKVIRSATTPGITRTCSCSRGKRSKPSYAGPMT